MNNKGTKMTNRQPCTTQLKLGRQAMTIERVVKNADGTYDVYGSTLIKFCGSGSWYNFKYCGVNADSYQVLPNVVIRQSDGWLNTFDNYKLMLTKKGAKELAAICEVFEQIKYWDEEVFCKLTKQSAEKLAEMKRQRDEYRAKYFYF